MRIAPARRVALLATLLRLGGAVMVLAFAAVPLPADWMAAAHEWLGLGTFPRAPLVDYLARSISLLYGFHGVLLLIIAGDPARFRPIVTYTAWMDVLFGAAILAIDIHAGLPWYWTAGESASITVFGLLVAMLNAAPEERT
jgi:hypothetical protein